MWSGCSLTPAVIAYEGIQYRYMAPVVMESAHLDYLWEHLRILSGFYGLLRPFDGVTPYRLEMQAKLAVDGCRDLYQFWGNRLARHLAAETDFVLNLASKEYSRAVEPHLPRNVRFVTCSFGERKDGKIIEKGTQCKMARGQMVRWLAENNITNQSELPSIPPSQKLQDNRIKFSEFTSGIRGGKSPMDSRASSISV